MTPPAIGAVVWVTCRPPQYRYMQYHRHGCWPGIVRAVTPLGHYHADPIRGWWVQVQPCGDSGAVQLQTNKGEIADAPCVECAGLWASWQLSQLGVAS